MIQTDRAKQTSFVAISDADGKPAVEHGGWVDEEGRVDATNIRAERGVHLVGRWDG